MRQCAYIVDWDYIASVLFSIQIKARPGRTLRTKIFSAPQYSGDLLLLSQYNMEVSRCAQEPSGRAASLLASLNLQREQAQFCDCVVRLRQNPGQLHPAHRCVLAASSPVLSSILSSTGALVELQAPCLSDAVLGLLLDYIYTGVLPYARNQHQYSNLLTAASYLQMDELQDALRACKGSGVRAADNTNAFTGAVSKYPLSLDKEDHHYPANVDTCEDIDPCRTSAKNGARHCTRSDASALRNVNIGCNSESVNTTNCRLVTPQGLIQNIPCMADVHWVSEVDKEVQKDQFHSAGTDEELEKTVENRRSLHLLCPAELQDETCRAEKQQPYLMVKSKAEEKQTNIEEDGKTHFLHLSTPNLKGSVLPSKCRSSSSSLSPHPCCGAVPVIRHSSKTACLQLAKMLPMAPLPHPLSPDSSSRTSHSRSGSTDSIVEGITTIHNDHFGEQNQHYRNNKDYIGTQSWDYKHSSDQSDILDQDYNCSNTDHLIEQNDEYMRNGLSHITDDNVHHAHSDSFQNMNHRKHIRDASMPQNNHVTSGLQYKTDLSFDDIPSKHHRLDHSDCHNVWMATAAEEQSISSQDPRALVKLPVQDLDTGSDSHNEELCSNVEAKEEHYYSRRAAESGRQESFSDSVAGGLSGFEQERMSGIEITDPPIAFTMPVNHNMADPSVGGPSYRGHLQYHCLPQKDVHFSHRYTGRNLVGTFASAGNSPLRQQVATGTTNQVLLLDISDKPAELLVVNAFSQKVTFGHGFGNNDEDQWNEETSVVGADNKYWAGETNMNKGKSVAKDQSRPGAKVIHKAGVMGGDSNPKDSGNQATTLTVSSPPSEPDSVQASMPCVLSDGIPLTPSASMPTNISARLSSPVQHPFQCSLCNRSFSQRGSLNRHVRSHLGVRPFPCPCCPMTFSRQYRVTEHMRVHQRCVLRNDFQKPPALRLERPQK